MNINILNVTGFEATEKESRHFKVEVEVTRFFGKKQQESATIRFFIKVIPSHKTPIQYGKKQSMRDKMVIKSFPHGWENQIKVELKKHQLLRLPLLGK
jgi:hypothetical protein